MYENDIVAFFLLTLLSLIVSLLRSMEGRDGFPAVEGYRTLLLLLMLLLSCSYYSMFFLILLWPVNDYLASNRSAILALD